jgi:hypothetical protein
MLISMKILITMVNSYSFLFKILIWKFFSYKGKRAGGRIYCRCNELPEWLLNFNLLLVF